MKTILVCLVLLGTGCSRNAGPYKWPVQEVHQIEVVELQERGFSAPVARKYAAVRKFFGEALKTGAFASLGTCVASSSLAPLSKLSPARRKSKRVASGYATVENGTIYIDQEHQSEIFEFFGPGVAVVHECGHIVRGHDKRTFDDGIEWTSVERDTHLETADAVEAVIHEISANESLRSNQDRQKWETVLRFLAASQRVTGQEHRLRIMLYGASQNLFRIYPTGSVPPDSVQQFVSLANDGISTSYILPAFVQTIRPVAVDVTTLLRGRHSVMSIGVIEALPAELDRMLTMLAEYDSTHSAAKAIVPIP